MKLALYSDLHAHPYNNGVLLEHGSNSRVKDAVGVIGQVYAYAKEYELDFVLFGGDLFDRRKSIDVDTYNQIHRAVQYWSSQVPTLMIPGNHDQANKSGTIHALDRFHTEQCVVVSDPGWHALADGVWLFAVPYYDDGEVISNYIAEGLKDKPSGDRHLLLIHYGIEGAKVGPSDYVLPCELSLSMLYLDAWDIVFSGHYHMGQQIGSKFHYIGSAMQHRWDDIGLDKTFVVYDSSDNTISRVPTKAPQFIEIRGKRPRVGDVTNGIVRVIHEDAWSQDRKDKFSDKLKGNGALSVEFRFEPKLSESDASERIEFSESGGDYQILDDYLESDLVNTSSFDTVNLLKLGRDILSQALDKE